MWLCVIVLLPACLAAGELSGPQNITSPSPCTDKNHLFLAPGVLSAGGTNRACVSRFYTEGPARLMVALVIDDVQAAAANRELPPGDGGCIDITVPQKPNVKAKIIAKVWYPLAQCSWERELPALLAGARVLAVQLERARYRPGETLRARVLALKPDLAPAHSVIDEVWLEGPQGAWEGSRAAQWRRVRTRMGVAQVEHELDALAPAGRWTARAKLADGSQGSAVFWVGDYELPPFQLSVRHAPRVLRTSERLVWTVCVRYPWTEAVEGMLVIHIRGAGGANVAPEARSSIRTVTRIRSPRACRRHAAAARRVGLDHADPPDVLIADFSFQEEGTRIWQNTTVVSQVVDQAVTLEFLRKLHAVISPGLPYKLKVKATRWDDKPAVSEQVRVCRTSNRISANLPQATNDTCQDAITDDRGIARVTFTANEDGSTFYTFHASLQNDSSVSAAPLHLPARHLGAVHASFGPIKPDGNSAKTYVSLYTNLKNVSMPLTIHYAVINRGGNIYLWGATTQCPLTRSSDYIPTISRNSICYTANNQLAANNRPKVANIQEEPANVDIFEDNDPDIAANIQSDAANIQQNSANETDTGRSETNDPDSLVVRHLLRVMLPIKVTHQMCPDSLLVAYFYHNGELVSASKHLEQDECFSNKAEATWLSRKVAPGGLATLRISTPGPALCALTALDSASKWNQPPPSVKDLVMTSLRRLMDSRRNLTEYEAAGGCFNTSDSPELPTNALEQTASWLAAAGVRVAGGDLTTTKRCALPPAPLMDDVTAPRSDFSEAWLWRLAAVGANGSVAVSARAPDAISRYEAGAVCVARTGISVAPPAVLQVFREFFIHADAPGRLRRGDVSVVRYRLFNYLYEPLSVQIQIVTDAHLEGPTETLETVCVGARASVARRATLTARAAGAARLAIRARSVRAPACSRAAPPHQPAVSDEVIITITVDPEGIPMQEHKSILLCGKGSPESSMSDVSWSWPPVQPVPGTESLTVWAMGDVKGPLLFDADGLVTLPRGCGEQNMARLAANLLAFTQLVPDSPAAATAKEHVARGFTRQLQYAHPAGGFSAFGAADATPSTWLTAFTLKYLRRAHQILSPELPVPPVLTRAESWLLSQQMENGCFRNEGQVFHRELRGGLSEEGEIASVALTAYVITALVDSTAPLPARVLRNTLACLRALPPAKTRTPTRVYAHALLGYAFMRLRSYEDELRKTNEASLLWDKREAVGAGLKDDEEMRELLELLKIAKRTSDFVWWETSSLPSSVEATAYALLALCHCGRALRAARCAPDARAAVRWLSSHRNHAGGFLSTQDTLVALEGISCWSSVQPSTPPNLTVKLKSGTDQKKILIQNDIKVPEMTRIIGKSQVDVSVEGTGCALLQATRSYNTLAAEQQPDKQLTVQATVHTDGVFDCDLNRTSCFCAAVVEVCVSWTGAFPTMALVEATLPAGFGVDAGRLYALLNQSDTLIRRIELSPRGSRVTLYLSGAGGAGGAGGAAGGHACAPLHCVGARARSRPAHVRVLDYYAPAINHTQMYTIPEDCPARIAHTINDYHSSDNLFNKAKSLTDSSEILISHEYSIDDIPEGIPLDDPLYDLGRDDIAYLTKYNEVQQAKNNDNGDMDEYTEAYNHYINTEKEKPKDNTNFRIKPKARRNNRMKSAIDDPRRNRDLRKEINHRKGHSIPFINNYLSRNFNEANRVNDYSNIYYRQSVDQSHLYPEQIFYDFNPYYRRLDAQHPEFRYFEKTKPYDAIDVNYQKNSFPGPFIADHEEFNKEPYAKPSINYAQRSNNKTYLESPSETNVYTNIEYTSPSKYYERSGTRHINTPNDKEIISIPKKHYNADTIHDPTITENEFKTTTLVYSSSKPVEFDSQPYAIPVADSIQSSLNNQRQEPVTDHTDNPNLLNPSQLDPTLHATNSNMTSLHISQPEFHHISEQTFSDVGFDVNHNSSSYDPSTFHSNSDNSPSYLTNLSTQPNNESDTLLLNNPDPSISSDTQPTKKPEVFTSHTELSPGSSYIPNLEINPNPFTFTPSQSNYDPSPPTFNSELSSYPSPPNIYESGIHVEPNKESQKVASQLDNPNLSGFHVIDSETDLEVPSGLEGPIPVVALPPQNFVAVAPPPGFQPPFLHSGYPRLYPPPPRPQYPHYRHVPAG